MDKIEKSSQIILRWSGYYNLKYFLMNCWSKLTFVHFHNVKNEIHFYSLDRDITFMSLNVEILVYCWVFRIPFFVEIHNFCTLLIYVYFAFLVLKSDMFEWAFYEIQILVCFKHLNFFKCFFICLCKKKKKEYRFYFFFWFKTLILFRALFSCKIRNPLNILFIFLI